MTADVALLVYLLLEPDARVPRAQLTAAARALVAIIDDGPEEARACGLATLARIDLQLPVALGRLSPETADEAVQLAERVDAALAATSAEPWERAA